MNSLLLNLSLLLFKNIIFIMMQIFIDFSSFTSNFLLFCICRISMAYTLPMKLD